MSRTFHLIEHPVRLLSGLAFIFIASLAGHAQSPFFKPVALNSLSDQQQFNCIYQDRSGLIWIGTDNAIHSFDGTTFKQEYPPGGSLTAAATALYEDSKGRLWFGFEKGGIVQYDRFSEFHTLIRGQNGLARITSFLEVDTGIVWAGTYGNGIRVLSKDTSWLINSEAGLSDNYIYSMIKGQTGSIWIGTDNGINILSEKDNKVTMSTISVDDGLPDFIVQSLAADRQGKIWIGMQDRGVCYYDPEAGSFTLPPALQDWDYGPVTSILPLADRVWIATASRGVVEFKPGNTAVKSYTSGNSYNLGRVRSMMQDREGHIWLVSNTEINRSMGGELEFLKDFDGEPLNVIHALTVDQDDNIWFGNDEGLYFLNPDISGKEQMLHYSLQFKTKRQKIMSLYRDPFGIVWIGTFGQGIIRFDPETGRQKQITENEGLANENILSIAGQGNEIWFGTLGGALKCILTEEHAAVDRLPHFDHYGTAEGLVNNYIYQVYLDDNGTPYFATDGSGVFTYRNYRFVNYVNTPDSIKNVVYSIATDDTGNTWLNIANEGLLKYMNGKLERVTTDLAHLHESFGGIMINENELIMAYDRGIDILNIHTGAIRHFEQNAGIETIDPGLNVIDRDSKNRVWIGTAKGLIVYRPSGSSTWERPVVRLDGVGLFLDPINYRQRSRFSHNENHLSFSFSGLWYQYPEQVDYIFKLEGHDLDWIKTRNKQVIYSDLKPGNYTFRVKAGIYDNFASAHEASYTFTIRKAFYQGMLFYLLIIIGISALTAVLVGIRSRQIRKKEEIIQERIRFQFEHLKSQLNPHFLFNSFSTLIALIEADSPAAVNYVEELSTLFRNMLEYKDQDLIELSVELRVAGNYINLQKKRFGESLVIDTPEPHTIAGLKIPPLTLQLLIENAIKHNVVSREKPLLINIYADHQKERIFVENTIQQKKTATYSMGIGLDNIINRYKLLTDKNVEVIHDESRFIVSLPFIP